MRIILGDDANLALERNAIGLSNRSRDLVYLRMLIVCIVRKMTDASYPEIARAMGLHTHSAVYSMHKNGTQRIKPEIIDGYIRKVEETLGLHDERVGDSLAAHVVARKRQPATVEVEEAVQP